MATVGGIRICRSSYNLLRNSLKEIRSGKTRRTLSTHANVYPPEFGLLFDIDGVLVRGKKVLPNSRQAFKLLTDKNGKFWVPTVFVTNAGNTMRQNKARQLSDWLEVEIQPEQVVMSHSPLKMFKQFQDKHVLVCGQGPTVDIAKHLGFTKITSIEALRQHFPTLDMVDHKRRKSAPCGFEKYFPPIDAVILFGEPVRWETNLQLVLDILLTNGHPHQAPQQIPYPHIPILACNMDLMWMAEACMPRFGHGCFLLCLESLYEKITGRKMKYTALVGKPSEITYLHAEHTLNDMAQQIGIKDPIQRLYCIGDNPETDIYGANLYNRYLQNRASGLNSLKRQKVFHGSKFVDDETDEDVDMLQGAESCESFLVSTGVYSSSSDYCSNQSPIFNHNHRDFVMDLKLRQPTHKVECVLKAVEQIFDTEGYS